MLINSKSTHEILIFPMPELKKHPNADSLSTFTIPDTDYTYVGKTSEWENKIGKIIAWCPPDSLVPVSKTEFAFLATEAKYDEDSNPDKLGGYARIKAKKLRGIVSYGLCVPITGDSAEYLEVKHYEPPAIGEVVGKKKTNWSGGERTSAPNVYHVKYDVDAFLKYGRKVFVEGEMVYLSEKINGQNARYVWHKEQIYCGSRDEWKREFPTPPKITLEQLIEKIKDEQKAKEIYEKAVVNFKPKRNKWWVALTEEMTNFCKNHPNWILYGENYGAVQKGFPYDSPGKVKFRAFDIMINGKWLDSDEFLRICNGEGIPTVPVIHESYPFKFEEIVAFAEGKSLLADHIREGVVVCPIKERWDDRLGRVKLKIINPEY